MSRRKSRAERLLSGTGHRPLPKALPDLPPADGERPEYVPADLGAFYEQFVAELRTHVFMSKLDEPLLALMAETWEFAQKARRKILREGLTLADGRRNPAFQIFKDSCAAFHQLASKFGLSPSDRGRLIADEKPKEDESESTLDGSWKNIPYKPPEPKPPQPPPAPPTRDPKVQ